jgi:hypothetical protein
VVLTVENIRFTLMSWLKGILLQTSPQFPYLAEFSKITLQGVLYQYNLHENAKNSFCTSYLHKPENLMAGDIYIYTTVKEDCGDVCNFQNFKNIIFCCLN